MRLTIFAFALLGAALPATASAETSPVQRFTHDGVTYTYSVTGTPQQTLVKGMSDAGPFELTLRNGKVRGTFDGRAVSFKTSDVQPVVGIVEVALR